MTVLVGYTSYNRLGYTRETLPGLLDWRERTGADARIVVVDDASTDGSREYLKGLRDGRDDFDLILRQARSGHAICSNLAWRTGDGDYVKFDNDVAIVRDDWLERLLEVAAAIPRAGVVAHNCLICLPDDREVRRRPVDGVEVGVPRRGIVVGACALIPARTRKKCGRWNEREAGQTFNRGLDMVYAAKVDVAGLVEVYASKRNEYVRCLTGGETAQYAAERGQLKQRVWSWTTPVIRAYRAKKRALNDVP